MKRFFAGILSVLLVAFLAQSLTISNSIVDKDVGYSLTIDQNQTVVTILPFESPVISGEVNYLLDRGVSVPDKGLTNQDILIFNNAESFECNLYYTIERIDLKLPTLTGFENQIDKYPFASDLGLRQS